MTMETLRVLLVEDQASDAKLVLATLRSPRWKIESERVEDADSLRAALSAEEPWDVVISDWSMPGFGALAALEIVRASGQDLPFIIVSGTIGEEVAVDAMRHGAHDFVLKDRLARLAPAIERELRERRNREGRRQTAAALHASEEQLRQSQKMEAVGRLAGGIAHDFNNLLSVILGMGELVLDELREDDPHRADIQEICAAGQRAAALTRQLLMFSRQQVLAPKVLDANELLSGLEKMLGRLLGEDVDLVIERTPSLGEIFVDPGSMEQVIMNLAVNARDAMPTGGKLTIRTEDVVVDASEDRVGVSPAAFVAGHYVRVSVTDTGSGIEAATQSRIFEPFFTTKDMGKGTGLGLSTVLGIVQQSGGQVVVVSKPGEGATFEVYLPRFEGTAPSTSSMVPASSMAGGNETILLVEDDDQVRKVAVGILRRSGYSVIEASNVTHALSLCEEQGDKVDLLLTDVVMPSMSGPELAKRLRAFRPDAKVLCMSGYTDDSIVRHGVLGAEIPFLQKPFTPTSLAEKVREVLDHEPAP